MKNTLIFDHSYLKQAAMSNKLLLLIFINFLSANALFLLFPTPKPSGLEYFESDTTAIQFFYSGEAAVLLTLTLTLLAACAVRFYARVTPPGAEIGAAKRLVTLRTLVVSLASLGFGSMFFHLIYTVGDVGLDRLMLCSLLAFAVLQSIASLVSGQVRLRT